MISYPPLYRPGIFERSFAEHSGYRFSLKQRFWQNMQFFENDGPCFLVLGGMAEASPKWILNNELPVMKLARKYHAAVFLLEHRFYGKSLPEHGFTMKNLRFLNIENALHDIKEFINRINEEMRHESGSPQNWVLFGGSYAGIV
ncbi:unnamed protein product [Gongylonema pulchrum]|uniref:Serine carboxypeptidase n=1 Tax=Gongylonema pulchrum TaxID=637853 RepID=A0A183D971_9BILA|nr:unnamed protein product [Gongylonema pulchrum]